MKKNYLVFGLIRPLLIFCFFLIMKSNSNAQIIIGDDSQNESNLIQLRSSYTDAQIRYLLSKEIIANISKRKQSFIRNQKDLVDYNFVEYYKDNGEVGFKNKEGEVIIRANFDRVNKFYFNDKNNLKITDVRKKNISRLINEKGKYVTDDEFTFINYFGFNKFYRLYSQSQLVTDKSKWGILDYYGKILTEPNFQKIVLVATLMDSISSEIKSFIGIINNKIGSYEFSDIENNEPLIKILQEPEYEKFYDLTGQLIEIQINSIDDNFSKPSNFFYEPSIYTQKKGNKYNLYCRSCTGKSFFDTESYDSIAPIEVLIDDNQTQIELLLRVKKQNKWGIVNLNGKYQVENEYDMILPFKNGFADIFKNNKKGILNKNGKVLLSPVYDEINQLTRDFKLVKSTTKSGLVDNAYEIIVTPDEDVEINLRRQFIYIKKAGKYGLITPGGNYIKPVYDSISSFGPNSTAYVFQNKMQGIIDSEGKFIVPMAFKSIEQFAYQLYKVFDGRYFGLYSMTGQKKSETEFDEITLLEGGKYLKTRKDINLGLLENGSCNILFSPFLQKIETLTNNTFIVYKQGKYGLYKNEKNPIIPIEFDSITLAGNDDYVIVRNQNKYQVAKINPYEIISSKYDLINQFQDGYSTVKLNSKWGAINQKGDLFIPVMYDTCFTFIDDKASVKLGTKVFFVNKKNEIFYNNYQGQKLSEISNGSQDALTVVVDTYRKLLRYSMSTNTLTTSNYSKVFTSNLKDVKNALKEVLGGELTERQKFELDDTIKVINKEFITSLNSQGNYAVCRICGDRFTHEGYSSKINNKSIVIWEGKYGKIVETPMYAERYNPSGSRLGDFLGNSYEKSFNNDNKPKLTKKNQADYCSSLCAQEGALKGRISRY